MTLMAALGRLRQADPYEFKARLVYRSNSRTARVTQRNAVSKQNKRNKILPSIVHLPSIPAVGNQRQVDLCEF